MRVLVGLRAVAGVAIAALMLGAGAQSAAAADAQVRYVITNGGQDVKGSGEVHYKPHGQHDAGDVAWSSSGDTATVPQGSYDVHVTFSDGSANKDFWIDNQSFAGKVDRKVEINFPLTQVTYVITNGGVDTKGDGQVHFYAHGHDGSEAGWESSGDAVTMPAGTYDVHVTFSDGNAAKDFWIDHQTFKGKVAQKAEIGLPLTQVHYVITNNGADTKGNGQAHFYAHGHDGPEAGWESSGDSETMPAGTYDVHITFSDGSANKDLWIDGQAFKGKVEKTVEIGVNLTKVRYVITNNGQDTKGNGQAHFYPAGHHDGSEVAWEGSGDTVTMPAGTYDVHIQFSDGSANKDLWIDNQTFSGTVEKTVEVGVNVTSVRYVVTNGGVDTKGDGQAHFVQHGHHDGPEVTWESSGDTQRMPAGAYDVHIEFSKGSAHKDFWIDNQNFSGAVEKTVEIGLPVTTVTYVLSNLGADLKNDAQVHYFPHGTNHQGGEVTWSTSGDEVTMAAGTFDVHAIYETGLIHKSVWLDNQKFSGTVKQSFDFKVVAAQPTVSVTENGKDVGDAATVDYLSQGGQTDFGTVRSGQQATVEQGPYDIHAWVGEADGWLKKQQVSGKPHYTIAVVVPTTATLTAGAPPPKACAIEVYGVNFDFNKATLRPESEPVLKQVLALFTATPSFAAEVSGHTDNIGTAEYNMKLSDARATAVKAWLVGHGVAATRVSSRGYGDTRPLVPNDTDANRFKNRRVELRRENCK